MNYSKNKINDTCHELRIWMPGRGSFQARRRFHSNKELESFKTKVTQLNSFGIEYVKRFLESEDFEELIKEATNPEGKKLGLLNTFGEEAAYWREYFYPTCAPGWRANVDGYERQFLKPAASVVYHDTHYRSKLVIDLSDKKLRDITPILLDEICLKLRARGDSQKTINLKIGWIQAVLNFSLERKRISTHNVITYSKVEPPEPDIEFWEEEEAQSFMDFTSAKYPKGSTLRWVYAAYLTALNLVARSGEQWALRPKSLKASMGLVRLSEQFDAKSKDFRTLKGKEARNAPMNEMVRDELESVIKADRLGSGSLIFRGPTGQPIDHDWFVVNFFEKDIEEWGGRRIKWHALRHTGATLMLKAGVDILTVQKILGHAKIDTTMRYLHAIGSSIKDAGMKFSLGAKAEESNPNPPTKRLALVRTNAG